MQQSLELLLLPPQKQLIRRIQISQSQQLLLLLPQLLPPRMPLPLPQPPPQKSRSRMIQIQLLLPLPPPRMLEPQPQLQLLEHKFPIMKPPKEVYLWCIVCTRGCLCFAFWDKFFKKLFVQDMEKHLHKFRDIVK